MRERVARVEVETVPGVTAMQDLASRAGVSLCEGEESLVLFPMTAGLDRYRDLLRGGDTVVAYKGGRHLPEMLALLDAEGRLDGAVVGSGLGLAGERVVAGARRRRGRPRAVPDDRHRAAAAAARGEAGCERAAERPGRGKVWFVGAGPGAADLLTLRAARRHRRGRRRRVGREPGARGRPGARPPRPRRSSTRRRCRSRACARSTSARSAEGLVVARIHSGDPALWGAVQEQRELCDALGLAHETIPGVSAFSAVAALVDRELTVPEVAQSVVLTRLEGGKTPMPSGETVRGFAAHGTTMALFLSAARSGQLQAELLAGGYPPDTPCVVAYQATWPDELVAHCTLGELEATCKEHKLWKHTLVLVGRALDSGGTRSHLYHPGHFHGYRRPERRAREALRAARAAGEAAP